MAERTQADYQALYQDFSKFCGLEDRTGRGSYWVLWTVGHSGVFNRASEGINGADNLYKNMKTPEGRGYLFKFESVMREKKNDYDPHTIKGQANSGPFGAPALFHVCTDTGNIHAESIVPGLFLKDFIDRVGKLAKGETLTPGQKKGTDSILDRLKDSHDQTFDKMCKQSVAPTNAAFCAPPSRPK